MLDARLLNARVSLLVCNLQARRSSKPALQVYPGDQVAFEEDCSCLGGFTRMLVGFIRRPTSEGEHDDSRGKHS